MVYLCFPFHKSKFPNNLQILADERECLEELLNDAKRIVTDEGGPQMNQLLRWIPDVESKLAMVDRPLDRKRRKKPHFIGYCSTNSYSELIKQELETLIDLKEEGRLIIGAVKSLAVEPEPQYRSQQLQNYVRKLKAAKIELRVLKAKLMQKIYKEEGPQGKQLPQVREWISRVDHMMPEFDSLIADYSQEIQMLTGGDLKSSSVAKALDDAAALKKDGLIFWNAFNQLWKCLMVEDIGVVGIHGPGGIGKTYLMRLISNKLLESPQEFDLTISVAVSKNSTLEHIQDKIAEKIGIPCTPQWKDKNTDDKAAIISNLLQKEKFALFLDDLWNEVDLNEIGIPPPNKENKSKIVFTTRSMEVCHKMEAQTTIQVEPLTWEEAWQLFQDFVESKNLRDILFLAQDVARGCLGLPLLLITVGCAMANKMTIKEWEHAVEIVKKSTEEGMEHTLSLSILKLCYDSLPNDRVKSCLMYCALFPENYWILKEELIEKWICEGFWDDGNSIADPMDEGYNIVVTLVYRCLLEEDEDEGQRVKMHGMIRQMCLWIASDEVEKEKGNHFVQATTQITEAPCAEIWEEATRISLMHNRIQKLTEVPESPQLLTLLLGRNRELEMISNSFFKTMKALTVLDLSETGLRVLPIGIQELVSLQYLNISHTKIETLPQELMKLWKLKYLNFEFTSELKEIPKQMLASFQSLQVLRMYGCGFKLDKSGVEELESLKDLKVLSIATTDGSVLLHLLKSHELLQSGRTTILSSQNVNYSFNF